MAERLSHSSKVEWAKAIIGMGVGIGGALGLALIFATGRRYEWSAIMLGVAILGGYASNEELKNVCPDKKLLRRSQLRFLPEELTGQATVVRADITRGLLCAFRTSDFSFLKAS